MSIIEFYSAPFLKSNPRKLIKLVFCPYVNKLVVGGGVCSSALRRKLTNGVRVMRPCWGLCGGGEVSPQLHYIRRDSARGSCETARRAESHSAHFSVPAPEAPQVSASSLSLFYLSRPRAALTFCKWNVFFLPNRSSNDERRLLPGWTPAHHQRSQQLAGDGPGHQLHVRSSLNHIPEL